MKVAEALVLRADLQRRVGQVRERLNASALVQEGDQPPEQPQALLSELDEMLAQLNRLIVQINQTNVRTRIDGGETLTEALARRDVLDLRLQVLKQVADTAAQRIDRYGRSEIKRVATVDVGALRRDIDQIARQRRELDTAIQATNWTTELGE
jgi:ABC-type siderophore export system fused ATPase/permease subunit